MTQLQNQGADQKSAVLRKLRREILTARLKVTLDEKRQRKTSPTVKFLAEMQLPSVDEVQSAAGYPMRTGRVGSYEVQNGRSGRFVSSSERNEAQHHA